jgi:2-C-methyl-D-erythritol 4-phosphate cytidylyltransferase
MYSFSPVDEDKSSVVVIHDAVRPLIDETVVKKIVCYAKTYGVNLFIHTV